MKRITSSVWISLSIIILIPTSWIVQFTLNKIMLSTLVEQFGVEVLTELDALEMLFISIPITQLVSLATIVIPSIFIRKAVREGTTNLTMPVGSNNKLKNEEIL